MLGVYIHSFLSTDSTWEKWLKNLPFIGNRVKREFQRRSMPAGLTRVDIELPAASLEFFIAALPRLLPATRRSRFIVRLQDIRGRILSRAAAKQVDNADAVVAFHDTAVEAFEQAGTSGVLRILDFPSAHPRFTAQLVSEEAVLHPESTSTLVVKRPDFHLRRMEREISLADFILVPSEYVKETFVQFGVPEYKLVIIPYGANVTKFSPRLHPPKEDSFKVLFAGRIEQLKGLSYLLEGYRQFHKPDSSLILAGAMPSDTRMLIPYDGLYQHAGHLHPADMPEFYRQGSVFVLPSLIEGWGFVVLEAMASGIPVIVTSTGPAQIVRNGIDGFTVPIRDPSAIADRLEILYRDPALRLEMGRSARERALEFTWDRYGSEVVSFLRSKLGTTQ